MNILAWFFRRRKADNARAARLVQSLGLADLIEARNSPATPLRNAAKRELFRRMNS